MILSDLAFVLRKSVVNNREIVRKWWKKNLIFKNCYPTPQICRATIYLTLRIKCGTEAIKLPDL